MARSGRPVALAWDPEDTGSDSLRSALTRGDSEDTANIAYFRSLKAILARYLGYPRPPAPVREEISRLAIVNVARVTTDSPGPGATGITGLIKVTGGTIAA